MTTIKCEICGSNNIEKQNGKFVCLKCGCKYSPDEAKRLLASFPASQKNTSANIHQQSSLAPVKDEKRKPSFLSGKKFASLAIPVAVILAVLIAFAIVASNRGRNPAMKSDKDASPAKESSFENQTDTAPSKDTKAVTPPMPQTIYASDNNTLAIKNDATVYSTYEDRSIHSHWTDIIQVAGPAALKKDGTVVVLSHLKERYETKDMTDIVQIASGEDVVVGLKKDGTVVAVVNTYGNYSPIIDGWDDIKKIYVDGKNVYGLKNNGTVVAFLPDYIRGRDELGSWENIVDCYAGNEQFIGITADGKIKHIGNYIIDVNESELENWENIKSVCAFHYQIFGLKNDGTVVATDGPYDDEIESWTDIVSIQTSVGHLVGLKKDGTVVAVGDNEYGQCKVEEWKDIISVSLSAKHTVGLKKDGTLVAVGYNRYRQCDVEYWTDIKTK